MLDRTGLMPGTWFIPGNIFVYICCLKPINTRVNNSISRTTELKEREGERDTESKRARARERESERAREREGARVRE